MKQYLNLIKEVLNNGIKREDRTKIGNISIFGTQKRYNLTQGFPLITTKKIHWKSIVHELLWFIKGDTNIKYLVENNVRIWNEWPYKKFKNSKNYNGETMSEFIQKIKNSNVFASQHGDLGPIYGKQWRNFGNVDQLQKLINEIKENSNSRRLIISSWNPPYIENMALPPCHTLMQFYVNDGKLSCQLYQRSADVFLGVPFNIASYSLLTILISHVTNLKPYEFIHTTGDTHIYLNHIKQVNMQLKRNPKKLPKIKINKNIKDITKFTFDDIQLIDYDYHPLIKAKVAV